MNVRILLCFIVAVACTACAGLGPTSAPDIELHVAKLIPKDDGELKIWAPAEWYPDQRGFPSFTERVVSGGDNIRQGVFVLSESSLLFAQWDKDLQVYNIMLRYPFADLRDSDIKSYGRNRCIVVSDKSYRAHTFMLAGKHGFAVDRAVTQAAADFIAARVRKKE